MSTQMTRRVMLSLAAGTMAMIAAAPLTQADPLRPVDPLTQDLARKLPTSWAGKKVAVRGRDVVSKGSKNSLLKGSKKYAAEWDNTMWYFVNEENRDLFLENPEKYVPQFGGFCPVALAGGHAKIGRTNQFTRIDNKLYLNYNRRSRDNFASKPEDYILRAQVNW